MTQSRVLGIERPWLLVATVIAGVGAVAGGWLIAPEDFLSSLLLELGAGLFLFALLLILGTAIETRIEDIQEEGKRSIEGVQERVGQIEETVAEVKESVAGLGDIGSLTKRALKKRRDEIDKVFAAFAENISPKTIADLLEEAQRIEAVDKSGVRVRIDGSSRRLRISSYDHSLMALIAGPMIDLTIEDPAGNEDNRIRWMQEDAAGVMLKVIEKLQILGEYGPAFDSGSLFARFRDTVKVAIDAKSTFTGGPRDLSPVIEIPGKQWAITTWGLECLEVSYAIEKERFSEDDWLPQMAEKTWVDMDDFSEAFRVAKAMYEREQEQEAD